MNITPRFQKLVLLAHITFSVGWFGAVLPYLALAVVGLTSRDVQLLRAAYISMELIGWYVIVPLSIAALLSGLVQSLGTRWGLFRHWWIVAKLVLTIFAVTVLLRHMEDVSQVARAAKETGLSNADFRPEWVHSAAGLVVLFVAMALSVFKPWGMTPYGKRATFHIYVPPRSSSSNDPAGQKALPVGTARWSRIVRIHIAHAVVLALLCGIILHLTGMHHH
jgi:hypothetical protein